MVQATIKVGPVQANGSPTAYQGGAETYTSAVWADYAMENEYIEDPGIYMGGLTSPEPFQGSTVAFVQLRAPTMLWVCRWTALRAGTKPSVPKPQLTVSQSQQSIWVLLNKQYGLPAKVLAGDGQTPWWRFSGTFVYGCNNPPSDGVESIMNWPISPFVTDAQDRTVPKSLFVTNLSTAPQLNLVQINRGGNNRVPG